MGPDRAAATLLHGAAKHFSIPFFLIFLQGKNNCSIRAPAARLLGPSWDPRSRRPDGSRLLLSHQTTNVTSVSQFFATDGYRGGGLSRRGWFLSSHRCVFSGKLQGRPRGAMLRGATEGGARCRRFGCSQTFQLRVGSYFASGGALPGLLGVRAGSSAWGVRAGLVPSSGCRCSTFFFFGLCKSKSTQEQLVNHHRPSPLPRENETVLYRSFCLFLHRVGALTPSPPPGAFVPSHRRQRAPSLGPGIQRGNFTVRFAHART